MHNGWRAIADIVIGLLMTASLMLSAWTLNRVVEHEKAIAVLVNSLAKLPTSYPPQDYRDMLTEKFNRIYDELKLNREIMRDVQQKVTK